MNQTYIVSTVLILFLLAGTGCKKNENPAYSSFFSKAEADSLMVDLITYVYKKPQNADHQSKFERKYRQYYTDQLPNFSWLALSPRSEDSYYFLILRPARDPQNRIRAVGGYFEVGLSEDKTTAIKNLREIFNTPLLAGEEAKEKGNYIYKQMIRNDGDISALLHLPHYIEFPNKTFTYDSVKHEWLYSE